VAKGKDEHSDEEDPLKYRPNPDMMDTKAGPDGQVMLFTSLLFLYTCYIADASFCACSNVLHEHSFVKGLY